MTEDPAVGLAPLLQWLGSEDPGGVLGVYLYGSACAGVEAEPGAETGAAGVRATAALLAAMARAEPSPGGVDRSA